MRVRLPLGCAGWRPLCCSVDGPVPSLQRKCLERGQQLCQAEQWCSLLEYAQQAWNFVRKMPDWEDASHNKAKQLCFRTLAAHCTTALKKVSLDQRQVQTLVSRWVSLPMQSLTYCRAQKYAGSGHSALAPAGDSRTSQGTANPRVCVTWGCTILQLVMYVTAT